MPLLEAYSGETILMFDRALAASANMNSHKRILVASALAYDQGSDGIASLGQPCRDLSSENRAWRDVCLDFGELLTERGQTYMQIAVGLSIQAAIHEYDSSYIELERVEALRSHLRKQWSPERLSIVEKIVIRDEAMLREYVDVLLVEGELAALDYAEQELLRLAQDPNYDPC